MSHVPLKGTLGGDPRRAPAEAVGEVAIRNWVMVEALDDWLLRQPSVVLAKRQAVAPVLLQRQ